MTRPQVFVPHKHCTVASGDCFVAGECLRQCQPRLPVKLANSELATALLLLQELAGYVRMMRGVTKYVDGSTVDIAAKQAFELLARNNR